VNGLEPTALLNQELDLIRGKQKPFYPKTESIRLPDKKCGSLMPVLCLSYLLVLEMINITGFIIENDADNGISMGEEHKLGIRASSTRQVFFNEKRVSVENMLSERGNGKIAMNALNVGRIKLAAACLDAGE
jgi:hypothetical protein